MSVSPTNKLIARTLERAFGGSMEVCRYYDELRASHVDILTCADRPHTGVTSFATVGLSDTPLLMRGEEYPARVEFLGACASVYGRFANVLASAAFNVINSRMFCAPGVIFPGVVAEYFPDSELRHVMFLPPFLWEDLVTLELPEKTVAWLLAVPVSEAELLFAQDKGPAVLEDRFEEHQIDVFDLYRPSVI